MKLIKKKKLLIRDNVIDLEAISSFLDTLPTLRIKSIDWYNRNKDYRNENVHVPYGFTSTMSNLCGIRYKLTSYYIENNRIRLFFEENKNFSFSLEMVELPDVDENILKYKYE